MNDQHPIKGNWLALIGAIWYLLEWPIIFAFFSPPPAADSSQADFAAYYAAHRLSISTYVPLISAAILGRLAFISGLRQALRPREGAGPLLDLAFASCIFAVTAEGISYAVEGVALGIATFGAEPPVAFAAALQSVNFSNFGVVVAHGLFAAAAALAMLRVRALPRWVGWLGLVSGAAMMLSVKLGHYPDGLVAILRILQTFGGLTIMVWMLATGILLARRAR